MTRKLDGYKIEMTWSWGGRLSLGMRFHETTRFRVSHLDDIPDSVRYEISRIVTSYAFDCSRSDHPLSPHIHSIMAYPVMEGVEVEITEFEELLQTAVEARKIVLEKEGR